MSAGTLPESAEKGKNELPQQNSGEQANTLPAQVSDSTEQNGGGKGKEPLIEVEGQVGAPSSPPVKQDKVAPLRAETPGNQNGPLQLYIEDGTPPPLDSPSAVITAGLFILLGVGVLLIVLTLRY